MHAIFTLPGVSILTVGVDLMHIKHLGTDKYMYRSVLYLLCFHVLSSSPLENLKVVAHDIRQYYKLHHTQVRYRYMNRLSMFMRKSGCPCLRGKAAEVKHLGKALEASWRTHMRHDREIRQQIALMLKTNNQVEPYLTSIKVLIKYPNPMPQS